MRVNVFSFFGMESAVKLRSDKKGYVRKTTDRVEEDGRREPLGSKLVPKD